MKLKQILMAGIVSFTALLILSLLFYKERCLLTDNAFHLFYFAKAENFAIQNNRFGAIFTQAFPIFGIRLGASLDTVMQLYSISFIIYYFIIFFLIVRVFKNRELSLIMLLWPVLFVSHAFYWMLSELPQGIAFMLLFFALYKYVKTNHAKSFRWNFLLALLLIFLSGFHPLVLIPVVFVSLFFVIHSGDYRHAESKAFIFLTGVFCLLVFVKSLLVPAAGYETSALGGVRNFIRLFPDYFTIQSTQDFLLNCLRLYYFIPLLLGIVTIHYFRKKQILKLLLLLISSFGYLLLVNVCYFENTPSHYIENLYYPLTIFLLFPLVYDVLPACRPVQVKLLLSLIIFAGLIRIYFMHQPYTTRLSWEKNYLLQNQGKKLIVDNSLLPLDTLIDTWATPYEFWLLSTSETGNTASIIFTDSVDRYYYWLPENKTFFTTVDIKFPYEEFNNEYFNFTDTSRYTIRKAD